jgi:hypothetical protein
MMINAEETVSPSIDTKIEEYYFDFGADTEEYIEDTGMMAYDMDFGDD